MIQDTRHSHDVTGIRQNEMHRIRSSPNPKKNIGEIGPPGRLGSVLTTEQSMDTCITYLIRLCA